MSVRTIDRDVHALSAAGVSVYAERGRRGGTVLADAYRDTLGRLSEGELRALFVSGDDRGDDSLADIGLSGGRRTALEKLVRAIPVPAREAVRETRARPYRWAPVGRTTLGALPAPGDAGVARARVLTRTFARPVSFDVGEYWDASRQSSVVSETPAWSRRFA